MFELYSGFAKACRWTEQAHFAGGHWYYQCWGENRESQACKPISIVDHVFICNQSDIKGIRAGPFSSSPHTWNHAFLDVNSILQKGDQIVRYLADAITVEGNQIPFPPLHLHHVHVTRDPVYKSPLQYETHGNLPSNASVRVRQDMKGQQSDRDLYNPHYFETHGDFVIPGARMLYEKKLPAGFGMHVFKDSFTRYYATLLFDDWRHATASVKPFEFFVEIVFQLSNATRPVSSIFLHNPFFYPKCEICHNAGQFPVGSSDAIAWWSGTLPASGSMLIEYPNGGPWIHMHRSRAYGLILFSAPAESFQVASLPCTPGLGTFGSHVCYLQTRWTNIYAKLMVSGPVVCRSNLSVPSVLRVFGHESEGIPNGSLFDRQGALICFDWTFRKGDEWTMVGFYGPRSALTVDATDIPMHTYIYFYFTMDSPSSHDFASMGNFNSFENLIDTASAVEDVRKAASAFGALLAFSVLLYASLLPRFKVGALV